MSVDSPAGPIEFETFPLRFGERADPATVRRVARAAEEAGFDAVQFPDHVALPQEIPHEYPFNESGVYPWDETTPIYDVFQVLSFVAGVTTEIRLKSSIAVIPFRHPVLTAKNALTLDALSDGRFEFGIGLGWLRTEFEVLGVPYEERGPRTDEFLEIWAEVCESGVVDHDGDYYSFQPTGFYPRPVQDGGPPIWVGGYTGAAFRRTAEHAVGWTAPGGIPIDEVRSARERILAAWEDYDRDGVPEISMGLHVSDSDETALRDPSAIREDVRRFADAGATRLTVFFRASDPDEQVAQMEWFGDNVVGEVR